MSIMWAKSVMVPRLSTRLLAAPAAASASSAIADACVSPLWLQQVRCMGRGPTVQGRKNATDAVGLHPVVCVVAAGDLTHGDRCDGAQKKTAMNAKLAKELTIVSKGS